MESGPGKETSSQLRLRVRRSSCQRQRLPCQDPGAHPWAPEGSAAPSRMLHLPADGSPFPDHAQHTFFPDSPGFLGSPFTTHNLNSSVWVSSPRCAPFPRPAQPAPSPLPGESLPHPTGTAYFFSPHRFSLTGPWLGISCSVFSS